MEDVQQQYQCSSCGALSDNLESMTEHVDTCMPEEAMDEPEPQPAKQLTGKDLWTDAASKLLLDLYGERQQQFGDPKIKKRTIWKEMSDKLIANGHKCSPLQTENKWKTMTAAYRRVKDNNSKSGRQNKTCPYEKDLEDLLGKRPNVEPVFLGASLPMNPPRGDAGSSTAEVGGASSSAAGPSATSSTASPCEPPPSKKRGKENREDRVLAFLQAAEKRTEASRNKWRQQKLKTVTEVLLNCHKEKMAKLDELMGRDNKKE